MNTGALTVSTSRAEVQPLDVLTGLGAADRKLISACIALFEDSKLSRRIEQIYADVRKGVQERFGNFEVQTAANSVQSQMTFWHDSKLTDSELRLVLWIYLREAFGLEAQLSVSPRGAEVLAAELAAAAVHAADPSDLLRDGKELLQSWGWIDNDSRPVTLADVVIPVFQDLVAGALKGGVGQMDDESQRKLIAAMRERLEGMNEAEQERLLKSVGAKELNDEAVRQILITGGTLTAFSAGVGLAGFSAYILAAQASAFIPFVSGPALVSVVAVLSNPITVVAATGGAIWWAVSSANSRVNTAVGLRVLALLALRGVASGRGRMAVCLDSFAQAESLQPIGNLQPEVIESYRSEWSAVAAALPKSKPAVPANLVELMNRSAFADAGDESRLARLLFPGRGEIGNTAAVGVLTLGDIVYSAASIDPTVIKAADFARVDEISGPLDFADLSRKIHDLAPGGVVGAISDLKGYVAERVVAAELVAQGHEVSFPDTPNEPGWDLLVDGHRFQIKCLADIGGIRHHFDTYEYPIFANAELAGVIPHDLADKVYFVEGYNNELVSHITEQSVDAGDGMFHPHVPIFAVGVSAVRNLIAYRNGRVSGLQAVEQIVFDGGTRAGLAAIGGFAGSTIGLMVFGPAGALLFGGVVPVLGQAQANRVQGLLDEYVKSAAYEDWSSRTHNVIDKLRQSLDSALTKKLDRLREKYRALSLGNVQEYVRSRIADEATFLRESRLRLAKLTRTAEPLPEGRATQVMRWLAASTVHASDYQMELKALRSVLDGRPPITDRIADGIRDVVGWTEDATKKAADVADTFWNAFKKSYSAKQEERRKSEDT